MNCNHCGSALAVLNEIDDGRFCSEEHRVAYLCATGNSNPSGNARKMQRTSPTNSRTRSRQLAVADPSHSSGFQLWEFSTLSGIAPPGATFAAEPFALEVVAPSSAIREAIPSMGGAAPMPGPRAVSGASAPAASALAVPAPAAWLPRMPRPVAATLLRGEALPSDRPRWHRWAALAACFIGIAATTDFLVSRHSNDAAASTSQGPAASFEDFTAGLARWDGAESGLKPWKLQAGKEALPNSLALFKPSAGMTNYRLEFSGDVRQNGISWAVRATDPQNYQALQVTERKKGAERQLWFTRYKVIAGKEGPRTQVQLQILPPAQSLWLVRMETIGETSTLWVENQIANSWSDAKAVQAGSIGFFTGKGDQYVLKKVRITPQ